MYDMITTALKVKILFQYEYLKLPILTHCDLTFFILSVQVLWYNVLMYWLFSTPNSTHLRSDSSGSPVIFPFSSSRLSTWRVPSPTLFSSSSSSVESPLTVPWMESSFTWNQIYQSLQSLRYVLIVKYIPFIDICSMAIGTIVLKIDILLDCILYKLMESLEGVTLKKKK